MAKYINIKPFFQSGETIEIGASEITEQDYNAAPPEYRALYAVKDEAADTKSKPKKNDGTKEIQS